jgi:hypothetical protein
MSKLKFDGFTHQSTLVDEDDNVIGTWAAYNNIDRHATLTHLSNTDYVMRDTIAPHHHMPDADGPYGLHGIVRFSVPGHAGIGVHSGRANARRAPGPAHVTMGCIRTTDEAMEVIARTMRTDQLRTIEVRNNSPAAAENASRRNHHSNLVGRHRG